MSYRTIVLKALEKQALERPENHALTIREMMRAERVADSKKSYVIAAVKKMIAAGEIRVSEYCANSKTQFMDHKYSF